MEAQTTQNLNAEYEVLGAGEGFDQSYARQGYTSASAHTPENKEDAFPSSLPIPQFLDAAPADTRKGPNPWNPHLVLDLALQLDDQDEILTRYNLTEQQLGHLYNIPAFRRDLALMGRELRENGVSFTKRAAVQAESYLETVDHIMMSPDTPASTRLEIFKHLAKLGKLEPKEDKTEQNNTQVNVNISF